MVCSLDEGGVVVWLPERVQDAAAAMDGDGAGSLRGFEYDMPCVPGVAADEEDGGALVRHLAVSL